MKHMKDLYQNMTSFKRIAAYVFMATLLFSLGYFTGSAKQTGLGDNTVHNGSLWADDKIRNAKMIVATEKTCAAAVKLLPGIADAIVQSHKRPEWECNAWTRKNIILSVNVTLDVIENRPLPEETIVAVGRIVAPAFGITDLKEISIVDVKNNLIYEGSGVKPKTPELTLRAL